MILVERSLIFADTVSSAICSSVLAQDATAPVHGAQPSVRMVQFWDEFARCRSL